MNSNSELGQESFYERLVQLVGNEKPFSWANRVGVPSSTFSRMWNEKGIPKADIVVCIAQATGVTTDWLLTGKGPMRLGQKSSISGDVKSGGSEESATPGVMHYEDDIEQTLQPHTNIPQWEQPDIGFFHYIPKAKAKLSAGGGMFVLSEDVSDYYAFRKKWLNRIATSPKNVVLMEVQGNSMAPTILDKDTVLIDTGRLEIIEGMIYAIRLDHTIMIKRLTHRPGGIINVISDNKEEFEPYQANRKDVHIIGQIIFFSRDLISGY